MAERAMVSSVFRFRARAIRLLRRIGNGMLELEDAKRTDNAIVAICTQETIQQCILAFFISDPPSDGAPGGFVLYFWLITHDPKWVMKMLREQLEVSQRVILFYVCMTGKKGQFLP